MLTTIHWLLDTSASHVGCYRQRDELGRYLGRAMVRSEHIISQGRRACNKIRLMQETEDPLFGRKEVSGFCLTLR